MDQNLYLAYDGSINADWVSRYAIQMAGNSQARKLTLLYIKDGILPFDKIQGKIKGVEEECRAQKVSCESRVVELSGNVLHTLLQAVPAGPQNYCFCGIRITSRGRGFLAGTISEQLLRSKKFNVLAIRVVNPGLLGAPGDLMFPLAGHPRGFIAAMPFLLMMAYNLRKLHILRIMALNAFQFRYMSAAKKRDLVDTGMVYVDEIIKEIKHQMPEQQLQVDGGAVLSGDWAKEILIQANKVHTRMILLGATEHARPSRFFRESKLEYILGNTPCDLGIYRKI